MPFAAPLMLGPFAVDALGRLSPGDPTVMPAFLFRWRDRRVRARFTPDEPQHGKLLLRATLGRVPSTASPHDPDLRSRCFQLLRLLPHTLPDGWRLLLLPDHGVRLEAEAQLRLPFTASDLLAALTVFLLRLAPYLDVLEDTGVVAGVPAAGSAKT